MVRRLSPETTTSKQRCFSTRGTTDRPYVIGLRGADRIVDAPERDSLVHASSSGLILDIRLDSR
jgi:hypothetical protein